MDAVFIGVNFSSPLLIGCIVFLTWTFFELEIMQEFEETRRKESDIYDRLIV
jgi:hypothetical protein